MTWPGRERALLEHAVGYALDAVSEVSAELMCRPTPCSGWDLRMLLAHVTESLGALCEGADDGRIGLAAAAPPGPADLVETFRQRAAQLLRASDAPHGVTIAGRPISMSILQVTGAVEVAVHGWDVSRACGGRLPIPGALARDLLDVCVLLVPRADRHPLFAPPVPLPPPACPADRLVAFLGRVP